LAAQKIDILKPDEEIEEIERQLRENPQQDPRAIATQQAAQVKAESEIKREQMRQEGAKLELQVGSEEAKMKREHDLQIALLNREIKMLELAQRGDLTLQEIKAMLSKEAMKLTTQKELAGTSPQVTKPPTEPPGRAPAGSAYAL
jgi:DNA-directed RNA polymerase alpha subunit